MLLCFSISPINAIRWAHSVMCVISPQKEVTHTIITHHKCHGNHSSMMEMKLRSLLLFLLSKERACVCACAHVSVWGWEGLYHGRTWPCSYISRSLWCGNTEGHQSTHAFRVIQTDMNGMGSLEGEIHRKLECVVLSVSRSLLKCTEQQRKIIPVMLVVLAESLGDH